MTIWLQKLQGEFQLWEELDARNMLYNASGRRPLRNVQPIVKEMLSEDIKYEVVPKDIVEGSYGHLHQTFVAYEFTHGSRREKMMVIDKDEIYVGEHVPERFRKIIAVHEWGHRKGLTHQELWQLELAMADELAKTTGDQNVKLDYIRWSSSSEMFGQVRGNLGREAEQERWDLQQTLYNDIKKRSGAIGVFRKEGEKFIELKGE